LPFYYDVDYCKVLTDLSGNVTHYNPVEISVQQMANILLQLALSFFPSMLELLKKKIGFFKIFFEQCLKVGIKQHPEDTTKNPNHNSPQMETIVRI
jgi:hypothetical protein